MRYLAGRIFQVMGLITLPSAIWVGHFAKSERASIGILLASLLVFAVGAALVRFSLPSCHSRESGNPNR